MENNKEVKNIADHPVEAPPPQGFPLADNPLRRPELQQLPVREEIKASPEIDQYSDEPKECCCCSHGCSRRCRIDPCGVWSWSFIIICILLVEVMTCCCCCQHCR